MNSQNANPEQPAGNTNKPVRRRRFRGVSAAVWALLGTIVGFSLPAVACIGFFFAFTVGMSVLGSQGTQQAVPTLPVHVSGPLVGPAIAIIDVNGTIVGGSSGALGATEVAAAEDIIALINAANSDPDVKAILLKVNSPGGSVVASDEIYHALTGIHKPIVVYMGEVAASGGYYISMAADHIVANPNTLTGSIGVISTFPNVEGLLEKVGVEFNVITGGEAKDFGSMYRDMTEEELLYWQTLTNEIHTSFIEIVAEGRGMTEGEVREIADGRVYTGRRALELGLLDELGHQSNAIHEAAMLGIIAGEPRVIRYSNPTNFFSLLGGVANANQSSVPAQLLERILFPRVEFIWSR